MAACLAIASMVTPVDWVAAGAAVVGATATSAGLGAGVSSIINLVEDDCHGTPAKEATANGGRWDEFPAERERRADWEKETMETVSGENKPHIDKLEQVSDGYWIIYIVVNKLNRKAEAAVDGKLQGKPDLLLFISCNRR